MLRKITQAAIVTALLGLAVVVSAQESGSAPALPPLVRSAIPTATGYADDMVHVTGRQLSDVFPGSREARKSARFCADFYMDRTEVTNDQFARFLSAADSHAVFHDPRMDILLSAPHRYEARLGRERYPVAFVDWTAAYAYARWAGKSLPTEAEWMVAALGSRADGAVSEAITNDAAAANGLNIDRIPHAVAVASTALVASTSIFDLGGNVAEWTTTEEPAKSGAQSSGLVIVKGGSFLDPPENLIIGHRVLRSRTERLSSLGFRCIVRDSQRR